MTNLKNRLSTTVALFVVIQKCCLAQVINVTGYLTDIYCWQRSNHRALDGALMDLNPERHTVHCLRDVAVCRAGGYGLLALNQQTQRYELEWTFDSNGNALTLDFVDTTSLIDDVVVTVTGTDAGGGVFNVIEYGEVKGSSSLRDPEAALWAHAVFMVLSWGILLPWGAVFARTLKGAGRDGAWFIIHRRMQMIGWGFQIIGFAMAVYYCEKHSAHFVAHNPTHTELGLAVIVVGTLQPLNALLRPHKPKDGEEKTILRLIWELFHKSLGWGAVIGGLINIFTGAKLVHHKGYKKSISRMGNIIPVITIVFCLLYFLSTLENTDSVPQNFVLDFFGLSKKKGDEGQKGRSEVKPRERQPPPL